MADAAAAADATGWTFATPEEEALGARFQGDGYVILPAEDLGALDRIRAEIARLAAAALGVAPPNDIAAFLNGIHKLVAPPRLNDLRLKVFNGLNAAPWLRPAYFATARQAIHALVGNELAMQRRVNLSIQMPEDDSSLLPVHADVWDGDSPFEVVLWIPFVDCFQTKSMFILPATADARLQAEMGRRFDRRSTDDLFAEIEPELRWIDIRYGEVLLFSQNLMHGNVVNRVPETRWTTNCRFKSLLSPYRGKRLGEFFEPITIRPATRIGMEYRLPSGFSE
ncbi:MAG: hypothetical protein OHK0024_04500 [Thalassobaculales bacterium]